MKMKTTALAGQIACAFGMAWMALSTGCDKPAAPAAVAKPVRGAAIQSLTNAAPAATNATVATLAPAAPVKEERIGEHLVVGFDRLASFTYEMPEDVPATATNKPPATAKPDAPKDQIPAAIRGLNNQKIALKGFMLPLKVEGGLITELLIMRDQSMCCFGTVPKINEWVSVKMAGKGVKPIMDQAITLFGKLQVGEIRENGYLVGIYEMAGEKLGGPGEL